jgi:type IV pilus assembly protein PilW
VKSQSAQRSRNYVKGFSLIELMVGLTIGLLVILVAGAAYVGTSGSIRGLDDRAALQERGRIALDILSDVVQKAGFFGNYSPVTGAEAIQKSNEVYVFEPNASPTSPITVPVPARIMLDTVLRGELASATSVPLGSGSSITLASGSDVLSVQYGGTGSTVTGDMIDGNSDIAVASGVKVSFNSQLFVVSDTTKATLFRVDNGGAVCSEVPATFTTLQHALDRVGPFLSVFTKGAQVMPFENETYFVGTANGISNLYVLDRKKACAGTSPAPLVANVEDMRLAFGLTAASTNVDEVSSFKSATAMTATDWPLVRSVVINLLVRSDQQTGAGAGNAPAYVYDATALAFLPSTTATSADNYVRTPYKKTVAARNALRLRAVES